MTFLPRPSTMYCAVFSPTPGIAPLARYARKELRLSGSTSKYLRCAHKRHFLMCNRGGLSMWV